MNVPPRPSLPSPPALDAVALHLLGALVAATRAGRRTDLAELADEIGVRRADCRQVLTTLHRQGYVDVLRMRPTLLGFALGAAAAGGPLAPLRATSAEEEGEPFGPPSERPPSLGRKAA